MWGRIFYGGFFGGFLFFLRVKRQRSSVSECNTAEKGKGKREKAPFPDVVVVVAVEIQKAESADL